MKQFIVLSAVLPIMMIFVMQAVLDQKSSYSIRIANDIVNAAKEEAKQEGSFTPQIMDKLRGNLSVALGVPPNEVSASCWEDSGYLYYRVLVPIKNVVAGNKLLGIKDEENQYMYVIDSYMKSREI